MEVRDQDTEIEMPSSLVFNRASSSKVSSTPINSALGESRRDHGDIIFDSPPTLDQHPLLFTQLNPQENIHKQHRRDLDIDPDPLAARDVQVGSRSIVTTPRQPQPLPLQAPPTAIVPSVRYRECQKNHAANKGGHVTDGCGEFMPSGEEGTAEALKCAACECHRNFHRREVEGESQLYAPNSYYSSRNNATPRNAMLHHHQQQPLQYQPLQQYHHHHRFPYNSPATTIYAPMMMNFGGGGGGGSGGGGGGSSGGGPAESSSEDLNLYQSNTVGQTSVMPQSSRKRFRTKFTQEQKDKMMEFAEKLGWKMVKQDDEQVQQFCTQVGVKRQVFKVWMHNNKQASKKKQMEE